MIPHTNKICKATSFHIYNIRRIRKYLNNDAIQALVHSIVIGRLDYCNSLLYKVPAVHMSKLQRIQNSAARLVCSTPRFNHVTPVLFSLHWLPVAYRIEFKILVLTFKAIYQLAPSYICNLVRLKEKCKYQLRSSEELLLQLPMGKTKKTLACEQAFGRAGNWEEGKAKRPVDMPLGPPFHGTRRASDPDASSYWREQ